MIINERCDFRVSVRPVELLSFSPCKRWLALSDHYPIFHWEKCRSYWRTKGVYFTSEKERCTLHLVCQWSVLVLNQYQMAVSLICETPDWEWGWKLKVGDRGTNLTLYFICFHISWNFSKDALGFFIALETLIFSVLLFYQTRKIVEDQDGLQQYQKW